MSKRDFLALEDWAPAEIEGLLALAARIKRGEVTGGLERKVLALLFPDTTIRTRTSFEVAMFLHGGHAVLVEPEMANAVNSSGDEHSVEVARLLGRYADGVGVRARPRSTDWAVARQDLMLKSIAQHCEKPVINLESARRHPCQALADAMTLRERMGQVEGKRFVLSWAWSPEALPTAVPASAALVAARLGMEIVIARPEGYELDPEDTALIRRTAQLAGGEFVHISDDPDDALVGADAVYISSWGSVKLYDKPDQERETRAALQDWRLTPSRLRSSRGGKGLVMQSGTARRNVEIDDKVLDSPYSAGIDQAENRLHAQRALLLELIGQK